MNRYDDFLKYRKDYPNFIYQDYSYEMKDDLAITYHFSITGLCEFHPKIVIPKKYIKINYDKELLEELIFQLGLVELISYVKCTCSPHIVIEAGYLSFEQIKFFQKLYYHGLGEMLYRNGISISMDELFQIECVSHEKKEIHSTYHGVGNMVCVGGGKDSCVSLELLKNEDNVCFVMNPKKPSIDCCHVAGYDDDAVVMVQRILDQKIIKLNQEGFLNGHTPLSALIAFLSYLCCYLMGRKKIVLSNEASANQVTVFGTDINHQYSKTLEFENDFRNYMNHNIGIDIEYFSLLRGLSEYNIAKLFSHYSKYHLVFKSCNLGSKEKEWVWCCDCPKCLFIYTILSPFLDQKERITIFGEDLFEREDLYSMMIDMIGESEKKPFECVGTFEEAKLALSQAIQKGERGFLLDAYQKKYDLELDEKEIVKYHEENNLGEYYNQLVKEELKKYD